MRTLPQYCRPLQGEYERDECRESGYVWLLGQYSRQRDEQCEEHSVAEVLELTKYRPNNIFLFNKKTK